MLMLLIWLFKNINKSNKIITLYHSNKQISPSPYLLARIKNAIYLLMILIKKCTNSKKEDFVTILMLKLKV